MIELFINGDKKSRCTCYWFSSLSSAKEKIVHEPEQIGWHIWRCALVSSQHYLALRFSLTKFRLHEKNKTRKQRRVALGSGERGASHTLKTEIMKEGVMIEGIEELFFPTY